MVKHTLKNGNEIYLDGFLKNTLDSLVYNIDSDWDFVIIITGDGMVRTGKSVLGLSISAYLADMLGTEFNVQDNIFFDGQQMIDAAQKAPSNSVFQYDEAREALAASKRFSQIQHDLIDFFNECGQLNHIFVLVLPDYFSLNWELATNRSELLLNVYRKEVNVMRRLKGQKDKVPVTIFQRGQFEMFNRKAKAKLYWKNKRAGLKQYNMVKPSAPPGAFTNNYPVSQEDYRAKKKDMLTRFSERHKKESESRMARRGAPIRNRYIYKYSEKHGVKETAAHLLNEYGIEMSESGILKIRAKEKDLLKVVTTTTPKAPITSMNLPKEDILIQMEG